MTKTETYPDAIDEAVGQGPAEPEEMTNDEAREYISGIVGDHVFDKNEAYRARRRKRYGVTRR